MGELSFDLQEEILVRIPVKDIVRFRFVCKQWKLLFEDERFIYKHITFAPNMFLVTDYHTQCTYIIDDIYGKTHMIFQDHLLKDLGDIYFKVVGHCNGIFCLKIADHTIVIWNPSLREIRKIKTFLNLHHSSCGFGYDNLIKDYKISIIQYKESYLMSNQKFQRRLEIITLKSSSRIIDLPYNKNSGYINTCGTLVDNYIFWEMVENENKNENEDIIIFDIILEKISYSCSPNSLFCSDLNLTSFRGRLCKIQYLRENHSRKYADEVVVWCANLEKINMVHIKSWNKLFKLNLTDVERFFNHGEICQIVIKVITKKGDVIMHATSNYSDYALLSYNFEKNELRKIEDEENPIESMALFEYAATLIPTS